MGSVELLVSLLEARAAPSPRASSPPQASTPSQTSTPSLVIVDGLDECQRNDDQCWILAQVSRMVRTHHLPLHFLIVSRPESHLMEAFEEQDLASITKDLSLYGEYGAPSDVSMYLRSEFSWIYGAKRCRAVMRSILQPWPSEDIIERLVRKSGGYFIYASTVIKFVDEEYFSPVARLDQLLDTSNASSELNPFGELDQLYIQILSTYPPSQLPVLKYILGYVLLSPGFLARGLFLSSIKEILSPAPGQMMLTLRGLGSLVSFADDSDLPSLIHASFGDFLLDKACSKHFHIDSEEWGYSTFRHVLSLACRSLRSGPSSYKWALTGQVLIFFDCYVKGLMCRLQLALNPNVHTA